MSFNKTKTDPVLGAKIQEHLLAKGVATPVVDEFLTVEAKEKISVLEKHFFEIWKMSMFFVDIWEITHISKTFLRLSFGISKHF